MTTIVAMSEADVVVVGAGSAGAVMAARLSEDARLHGRTDRGGRRIRRRARCPPTSAIRFRSSYANPGYFWPGQTAAMRAGEPQRPFLQPRVMGGGSSVMGMLALPGLAADYDRWEAMGATGWGWRDVAPAFRALLDDLDADQRGRNAAGPYPVQRLPREVWPAYHAGSRRRRPRAGCRGAAGHLRHRGRRVLRAAAGARRRAGDQRALLSRRRTCARGRTCASSPRAGGGACCSMAGGRRGVRRRARRRRRRTISAREVVVSAGAVNSPALLLRSGIGAGRRACAVSASRRWPICPASAATTRTIRSCISR